MHCTRNILQTNKQMSLMRGSNNQFMRICQVLKENWRNCRHWSKSLQIFSLHKFWQICLVEKKYKPCDCRLLFFITFLLCKSLMNSMSLLRIGWLKFYYHLTWIWFFFTTWPCTEQPVLMFFQMVPITNNWHHYLAKKLG